MKEVKADIEVDIKCPNCGKLFKITEKAYKENQDIVCPKCGKIVKPQGNEAK